MKRQKLSREQPILLVSFSYESGERLERLRHRLRQLAPSGRSRRFSERPAAHPGRQRVLVLTGSVQVRRHQRAVGKLDLPIAPDMAQFRATALGDTAAQLYAPVLFMIGPAGQQAQPMRFFLNQTLLRAGADWRIASILPIPAPATQAEAASVGGLAIILIDQVEAAFEKLEP